MNSHGMPHYLGPDLDAHFHKRNHCVELCHLAGLDQHFGKRLTLSKRGLQGNDAASFVRAVRYWVAAHPVLYHKYWNAGDNYEGRLPGDRWLPASKAFRRAFCLVTGL